MEKVIALGAEAKITKSDMVVTKSRLIKSYRFPILDTALRRRRTRSETKLLAAAVGVTSVPRVLSSDDKSGEIKLSFVPGEKLASSLDVLPNHPKICRLLGEGLASLHDAGIIHGDLTTSNLIWGEDKKLYFIDFGLGYFSIKVEDKAVDLHLIKEALEAKHTSIFKECFAEVLKGYEVSNNADVVKERLIAVEKRGRYKEQY